MPETIALFRIAWMRHRWWLFAMTGIVALGQATTLLSTAPENHTGYDNISIFALSLSLLPAAIASIALFDYGHDGDMNLPGSGCSPWLLRLPIASWKIAIIPVILKTTWISILWLLFAYSVSRLDAKSPIPKLGPCLAFSASSIWILVVAWRPFRTGWGRLVALALLAPIFYFEIGMVLVAPSIKQVHWRPSAEQASLVAAVAFYISGVWILIRTVAFARTSAVGIIPATLTGPDDQVAHPDSHNNDKIEFRSPFRALVHHELAPATRWAKRLIVTTALPLTILLVVFSKLSWPVVVSAMVGFAYIGLIAVSRKSIFCAPQESLATHIAASPIRTCTIAWARLITPMFLSAAVYSLIGFIFLGWALRAENRDIWMQWASDRADALNSNYPAMIGVRWSLVIVLGWPYFCLTRLAAYLWIDVTRRATVSIIAAVLTGSLTLIPLVAALRWFMIQTDWETTRNTLIGLLNWIPITLVIMLLGKMIATIGASALLLRNKLADGQEVVKLLAIWLSIVSLVCCLFIFLIPDRRVPITWIIGTIVILTPISRVLLMPVGIAWDRHR